MRVKRQLPEELRDNWGRAYQFLFVQCAPAAYIDQFQRFKEEAGITDRLIVAVMEKALETGRRHPLAWVQTVLAGLVPYGVTTPEEWEEHQREQAAEEVRIAQEREAERLKVKAAASRQPAPTPKVNDTAAAIQAYREAHPEHEQS